MRDEITVDENTTVENFQNNEQNKKICKLICDSIISELNYEISFNQLANGILMFLRTRHLKGDVLTHNKSTAQLLSEARAILDETCGAHFDLKPLDNNRWELRTRKDNDHTVGTFGEVLDTYIFHIKRNRVEYQDKSNSNTKYMFNPKTN
jgi:hypothetical protein